MKSGKAPGIDNITADLLRADNDTAISVLHDLFSTIWKEESVPEDWCRGLIVKLPKKGDLTTCRNWTGITLMPTIAKVMGRILIKRIVAGTDAELRKEQAGLRKGRSTIEQIFVLWNIVEQAVEWNSSPPPPPLPVLCRLREVDGQQVKDVDSFDYLGARVTRHGGAEKDIKSRLGKARGAFNKLVKIWRSGQLSKNTKIRIFKSNVIAVLLYVCETWRMTKRGEAKLLTHLRRILRIYWPMRVSNEEVRRQARTCTISEQIRRRM
ncbi:hypothetical protein ACROYT_G017669 [Oculina patagonica]